MPLGLAFGEKKRQKIILTDMRSCHIFGNPWGLRRHSAMYQFYNSAESPRWPDWRNHPRASFSERGLERTSGEALSVLVAGPSTSTKSVDKERRKRKKRKRKEKKRKKEKKKRKE